MKVFILLLISSTIFGCTRPREAIINSSDEISFTSNLVPYRDADFRPVSIRSLKEAGYSDWIGKEIIFRMPASSYKEFRYYNVAKTIYDKDFAIDLFENGELAGRRAAIENFYILPGNNDSYYVKIQLPDLKASKAYVVLDKESDQIDNAYFVDDVKAVEQLVKKKVWKNPEIELAPYGEVGNRELARLLSGGLLQVEILSYSTRITDEAAEGCSILLNCRDFKKRSFRTCYVPDAFFSDPPETRYPSVPKDDWKLIHQQEIAKEMGQLALQLSWGNPREIETMTWEEKPAERWRYGRESIILIDHKIVAWEKEAD